jgi:hypothetical protein
MQEVPVLLERKPAIEVGVDEDEDLLRVEGWGPLRLGRDPAREQEDDDRHESGRVAVHGR